MKSIISWMKTFLSTLTLISTDVLSYYFTLYVAVKLRNFTINNVGIIRSVFPFFNYVNPNTIFRFSQFLDYWIFPLLFIGVFAMYELYQRRKPFWYEVERYVKSLIVSTIFMFALIGFMQTPYDISRMVVIYQVLLGLIAYPTFRYISKFVMYKTGIWKLPSLVITDCEIERKDILEITEDPYLGYKAERVCKGFSSSKVNSLLASGNFSAVIAVVKTIGDEKITSILNEAYHFVNTILVVPYNHDFSLMGSTAYNIFNQRLFILEMPNTLKAWDNRITKAALDFFVGWAAFIVGIPIMLIISILIIIIDKSNPFFINQRYGINGKPMKIIKFQTMHPKISKDKVYEKEVLEAFFKHNPEARKDWQMYKKIKGDDPRISRTGKFLRKSSLDELPQLFNIILGQMSLVGPRPYLERERKDMGEYFDVILSVKPGLTGLWQISGRNDTVFEQRLQLDSWYVRNWSVWLDIVIFIKTARKFLSKSTGAY